MSAATHRRPIGRARSRPAAPAARRRPAAARPRRTATRQPVAATPAVTPPTTYARRPSRGLSDAASRAASAPTPRWTALTTTPPVSSASRSSWRGAPSRTTRAASVGSSGSPSARARSLPVPSGISPMASCSSPARWSADTTTCTLPSPPHTTTRRPPRPATADVAVVRAGRGHDLDVGPLAQRADRRVHRVPVRAAGGGVGDHEQSGHGRERHHLCLIASNSTPGLRRPALGPAAPHRSDSRVRAPGPLDRSAHRSTGPVRSLIRSPVRGRHAPISRPCRPPVDPAGAPRRSTGLPVADKLGDTLGASRRRLPACRLERGGSRNAGTRLASGTR